MNSSIIITCILILFGPNLLSQSFIGTTGAEADDYAVMRHMLGPSLENDGNIFSYEYKLHPQIIGEIHFYISGRTFVSRSNLDIYNNIIYADFDKVGLIRPYSFQSNTFDSLRVFATELKSQEYIYYSKKEQYAEVRHKGKYIIADAIEFKMQKGNLIPAIDGNSFEDRVRVKKTSYLIDLGQWYKIPKNKNDLIEFISFHFKQNKTKSSMKGQNNLEIILALNSR